MMKEYVVVIKDTGRLPMVYRASSTYTKGLSEREALDNWKKNAPREIDPKYYEYVGIISIELANQHNYSNASPGFDNWVKNFFLTWVAAPGNFIPLDGPTVQVLLEDQGGRLVLSGTDV
jgi:hypothetical protein